jgi:hypothetical protein
MAARVKGKGMEGKGREGKGREGKGREGKGREGKGREGKGREGKGDNEAGMIAGRRELILPPSSKILEPSLFSSLLNNGELGRPYRYTDPLITHSAHALSCRLYVCSHEKTDLSTAISFDRTV